MALFPTQDEARGFENARALATWAGLANEPFETFEVQVGSQQDRIRNLTMLPQTVINGAATAALVPVPDDDEGHAQAPRRLTPVPKLD